MEEVPRTRESSSESLQGRDPQAFPRRMLGNLRRGHGTHQLWDKCSDCREAGDRVEESRCQQATTIQGRRQGEVRPETLTHSTTESPQQLVQPCHQEASEACAP